MATPLQEQLADKVEHLSPENQQRLLGFADALLAAQTNPAVATWMTLAAMFPPDDLADMERAINDRHERDDAHAE